MATFKDRIAAEALRARERAQQLAGDAAARTTVGRGFEDLRALLRREDGSVTPEQFLLALVRAVRDEEYEEVSARQVRRSARRRHRRLGVAALAAGPFAGVAAEVVDLYGETATLSDVVDQHGLELDDHQIAAHLLVLWDVCDDLPAATATIAGTGRPIAATLRERLVAASASQLPVERSTVAVVKALWQTGELRERMGRKAVGRVVRPGRDVKRFIARAEQQLGVA